MNANEPVKLRKRKTRTGLYSLYLDTYANGKRTYEYLRLYLVPERTREDKRKNKETLQLAEAIRAKRVIEYHEGRYGFDKGEQGKVLLFDYFEAQARERTGKTRTSWINCIQYLAQYETRKSITFAKISPEWIEGFKDYLGAQKLAQNTKSLYFAKLRACINQAYKDGIITDNPLKRVGSIKHEESKREYLTIEEVQRLAETDCDSEVVKRAFLFSCLTGLRKSDIMQLQWGDIHKEGDYTRITFRQRKTGGQEYLDITHEARELMGEEQGAEELVFAPFPAVSTISAVIKAWTARAGIRKHITFHSARHTFATMMLTLGTDLYTVSKLLGHKDIKTTEIYAKIVDKGKQEAVARIPSILGKEE
ncbi:site-specific integrase [uncultured Porphyromonas sp.]|uniref:site-specific integrase n=1 Tax=uncultured Porphyromonas sp. TaxID=159274 RepID=UPI00260DAAD7|nr:site-specific integrase [uncultured Porphyromonas sp.]